MCGEGDAAAAPPDSASPPRDGGGRGGVRVPHAEGVARDDKRVGHRKGRGLVGGAGSVQAVAVSEPGRARFQREQLRVHSVRVGSEILPRNATGSLRAGSGRGALASLLHVGVTRWVETQRVGHE